MSALSRRGALCLCDERAIAEHAAAANSSSASTSRGLGLFRTSLVACMPCSAICRAARFEALFANGDGEDHPNNSAALPRRYATIALMTVSVMLTLGTSQYAW